MRKYVWIVVLALIASAVYFTSCERVPQEVMETIMPDAEKIEPPPEMVVQTPVETVVEAEPASTALKDPNSDGDGEWIDLERYAPDTLSSLSSTIISGSQDEITELQTVIIFVNCTETDISSYWLDHDRNEVLYQTLAPGESYRQQTWEGHVWIVKDAAENNIALYIARDEIGRALLMAPGMPAPEPPTETVVETPGETPPEMVVETPAETPPEMVPEMVETPPEMVVETPAETTDLSGGMVDIKDAMSTIGLRKIYWTDDDSLLRANPDGSGVETLFDRRPDLEPTFDVRKLVVDSEGGKIYWNGDESTDRGGGMWRANLDGTNLERLTTIQTRGFALDLEAGKIYWVTYDGNHMFQRSNLDGSGVEKFNTQAILGQPPSVIEFDPVDRKIYAYLFDYTGVSVINTDDLDIEAADIEFQVPIPTSAYSNLTLDIEERKIYWVTDYSGIYRINLDGTGYELVMDEGRIAATFDFNTRKIYWANRTGGPGQVIWQANLDGSEREGLFALPYPISGIAVETGPIN